LKQLTVAILLLASSAWSADYALIVGAGVDGNGTYACVNVTGAGSSIGHATLADCKDDALNVGESLFYTNSASWCDTDADCTITIASGKTLTGSNNAWRVAPAGDGTDSTTNNVVLSAYPFAGGTDYSNLGPKKAGQLLDTASDSFTESRGRTGNDIGYYQHVDGLIKVARKYLKTYNP
jgi:hypothetical protein